MVAFHKSIKAAIAVVIVREAIVLFFCWQISRDGSDDDFEAATW